MRVLITYFSTGLGHKSPAIAIAEAIRRIDPKCEVDLLDCGTGLGVPAVERELRSFWNFSLARPSLFRPVYHISNSPALTGLIHSRHANILEEAMRSHAERTRPDICVTTHFTSAAAMVKAGLKVSVITTEPFGAHAFWAVPGVKEYIVASQEVRRRLRGFGVKEPITVFNYPLKPLRISAARPILRKRLGVNGLCVLMSGGGEGVSNSKQLLQAVVEKKIPITVLFVCGRNQELHNSLKGFKSDVTEVRIFGFVKNLSDLMAAADVVAAKTGANTALEALALKRPFICTQVMENEKDLMHHIVRKGFGWEATDARSFIDILVKISREPGMLRKARANLRKASFKSGADEIARHLLSRAR